jgi:hypothetical protein
MAEKDNPSALAPAERERARGGCSRGGECGGGAPCLGDDVPPDPFRALATAPLSAFLDVSSHELAPNLEPEPDPITIPIPLAAVESVNSAIGAIAWTDEEHRPRNEKALTETAAAAADDAANVLEELMGLEFAQPPIIFDNQLAQSPATVLETVVSYRATPSIQTPSVQTSPSPLPSLEFGGFGGFGGFGSSRFGTDWASSGPSRSVSRASSEASSSSCARSLVTTAAVTMWVRADERLEIVFANKKLGECLAHIRDVCGCSVEDVRLVPCGGLYYWNEFYFRIE